MNLGKSLATVGVLGGIVFAMKKNQGVGMTIVYALAFGLGGMYLGNAVETIRKK
jgi:hypothetical protein